jgi:GNAT superfamily N-acetyltransferase
MALFQSPTRFLPEGFTFRGANINDIPSVAILFHQHNSAAGFVDSISMNELRMEWHTPHFNPAVDIRLVLDQREHLIGYIEVWTQGEMAMHPWIWGCVHPDYEGRQIGTTLLIWAEARARLSGELVPVHLRVAPRFGIYKASKTAPALCHNLGWQPSQTDRGINQHLLGLSSATRLLGHSCQAEDQLYLIFEKEIRPGAELNH